MSNINNTQVSGKIVTPFVFKEEDTVSLTNETLSVIGTSNNGPAFVPQQVTQFEKSENVLNTWENLFGDFEDQDKDLGPLTSNVWLQNKQQLTYTRILGIGDGKGLNQDGKYDHAGFIVGDSPLSGSINRQEEVQFASSFDHLFTITFNSKPLNQSYILIEAINLDGILKYFKYIFDNTTNEITLTENDGTKSNPIVINLGIQTSSHIEQFLKGLKGLDDNNNTIITSNNFSPSDYFTEVVNNFNTFTIKMESLNQTKREVNFLLNTNSENEIIIRSGNQYFVNSLLTQTEKMTKSESSKESANISINGLPNKVIPFVPSSATIMQDWPSSSELDSYIGTFITITDSQDIEKNYIIVDEDNNLGLSTGDIINGNSSGHLGNYVTYGQTKHNNRDQYDGFIAVVEDIDKLSFDKSYRGLIDQLKIAIEHENGHNGSINVSDVIESQYDHNPYNLPDRRFIYQILISDVSQGTFDPSINITRNLDFNYSDEDRRLGRIAFHGSDTDFSGGNPYQDNRLTFKIKDILGSERIFRIDTETDDGEQNDLPQDSDIDYNISIKSLFNENNLLGIKDKIFSTINEKITNGDFSYGNNNNSLEIEDISNNDNQIYNLSLRSLLNGKISNNIVSVMNGENESSIFFDIIEGHNGENSQIKFTFNDLPKIGDSFTLTTIDPSDVSSSDIKFSFINQITQTENGHWDSQNRIVSIRLASNIAEFLENIKDAIIKQGVAKGNISDKYEIKIIGNSIIIKRKDIDSYKNLGFVFDQDVNFSLRRTSLIQGESENPVKGLFGDQTFFFENQQVFSTYTVNGGIQGKTHFFGSVYENINFEDYISPYDEYIEQVTGDSNLEKTGIITDVVFATSGSVFYLQNDELDDLKIDQVYSQLSSTSTLNTIDFGSKTSILSDPKVYIQGQKEASKTIINYPNKTNLYNKSNLFESSFNTTPEYYLYRGNLNYASFRNTSPLKDSSLDNSNIKHFVSSGKNFWNTEINDSDGSDITNYESFESIYQKAKTPWIVSQPVYKENDYRKNISKYCKKLFRFHSYSDGKKGNKYRFRIKPRRLGKSFVRDIKESWSIFDLIVYKYDYKNNSFDVVLEFFELNLNPKSENYIGKLVGTENEYYDIDKKEIINSGFYKKTNNHIFVEISDDVEYMVNESTLIPSGFFPYPHMNIDESKLNLTGVNSVIHNPIIYVGNRRINEIENNKINYDLSESHWGVLFDKTRRIKIDEVFLEGQEGKYKFEFNKFIDSSPNEYHFYHNYTKYFQNFRRNKFWITPLEDTDNDYHNDFFHLEKILYLPNEEGVNKKWEYSFYRRDAKSVSDMVKVPNAFSYINIDEVLTSDSEADSPNSKFLSFDFFSYGGFDGINILDDYKRNMSNESCLREYEEEIPGQTKGQTTYAYETAKNIALDIDNFRCDVFYIPGISHPDIVSDIINEANNSTKFTYVFDTNEYDELNNLIKDSYYFNNTNNNILDLLDERDNIKSSLIDGTNNSFRNQYLRFFNSKYSISLFNRCEASINDKVIEIPASLVFINSLSQSLSLGQSIDNVTYDSSILTITNIVNSKFIYNNNDFDQLLINSKKKDYNINPIGIISANRQIKPLSSNTLVQDRKNIFSLYHNTRIYLDIKRNLKNLLLTSPVVNGSPLLFSLNSENDSLFNTRSILSSSLEEFLSSYQSAGVIKDYFVDVSVLNTEKFRQQKLENTLSGSIGISFFGDELKSNIFTSIKLDNLINDINDFTEDNNTSIIDINN